jgi:hypothetical protein
MGDVNATYGETGKKYLKRLYYVNISYYIVVGFLLVVYMVDLSIIILGAALVALASVAYALYFTHKNPPIEYEE